MQQTNVMKAKHDKIMIREMSSETIRMIGAVARGNIALHEAKLQEDALLLKLLTEEIVERSAANPL